MGLRNLLRFLANWGSRSLTYRRVPADLVEQINMIPALLGEQGQGVIESCYVPYECRSCGHESEHLRELSGAP